MTDITFLKTRYHYDSYIDFWRLVESSKFSTIYVDELDVSKEGVYIVAPMNGEYRPHIDNQSHKDRNAHLILWNLERPSGHRGSIGNYAADNRDLIYNRYVDEVWVSDARLADETQHATRFVVLGSHPELGKPGAEKKYDFCHMSYEVPRRQTIYKQFPKSMIGPNSWGDERHRVLQQSRFALNVHQDNHPFQEPLRWALFAAYGLPIISESCYDPNPWAHNDTIHLCGFDDLVVKIRQIISGDYSAWREMGERGRQLMTVEYEFGKMVRQAVDQSVNHWR